MPSARGILELFQMYEKQQQTGVCCIPARDLREAFNVEE